ncbi:c-type cytochrome biogenesis protein CcmI [Methylocystis sp. L43]|uniref:c-type cytochrome biogenesis protein CcmI n=1 Tax=unclassified Methylocystis TaxID=2625913 RepID=UPI0018C2619D|nr:MULTISPECIES: c-type cytochrome biogenesis protein CcmI [unclassified Methylocystis]MBG0799609.1 c-type cytochrome biogenesis protein CcmI [Methylocystis sp. L43]MBG0807392.1 c-type cytochrome biogenesis protein CcmI [Methylocystis sp. H15]
MIWLIFALLTGAAVMAVLAPLAMRNGARNESAADVAFFEEQIAEIEREREEGRLDSADAGAAKTEAARRLLRAEATPKAQVVSSRKLALGAALAAIVVIPAVALTLYARLGHSDMPDMPLTARLDSAPDRNDLSGAVARIEQHLREHPEDGRGFEVIAPYLLRTGRGEDAVHAYSEALRLLGATAARHAALGEARVVVAQGVVTPQAKKDFEAALALDAAAPEAQYYLGVAAAQAGEKDKAIAIFSKMAADAPADAAYLKAVNAQLAILRGEANPPIVARGPSSEQGKAIAAMPADQRQEMIRGMVDRLASRLESKGDDVEGWLKLIRAYSVLAETEKAKKAVTEARKALASKQDDVARIEALAKELNIGG